MPLVGLRSLFLDVSSNCTESLKCRALRRGYLILFRKNEWEVQKRGTLGIAFYETPRLIDVGLDELLVDLADEIWAKGGQG